jgi:hypothetical protein
MEIEKILGDLRNEPPWRSAAATEMAYYANHQLSRTRLDELEERGMEPVVRNIIFSSINSLLGLEERNRQDWRVSANGEQDTDEAVALSRKLHEVERLSAADRACSDAFAHQVKIGVGWLEVRDNHDPFGYPVVCDVPQWQEMWWDWRARKPLLDDARFILRRKWFDADVLAALFPGKAKLIENAIEGWPNWFSGAWEPGSADIDLGSAFDREMTWSLGETEWRQSERKRLALFEVWYRKVEIGVVLRVPEQELVVEFDKANPIHVMLAESGMGSVSKASITRMRRAYWVGPHKLADGPSPYAHSYFPYVPFFGFREDETGIPFGLIRLQKSAQDEANRRLSKMDWLLNAKTLIADSDAFDQIDWSEVIEEAGRPDAALPLNPRRTNPGQVPKIQEHADMSAQQFSVLQDALKWISEVGGIYQAMLGKSSEQQSGVAINSLVEQGSTTQGELFGNYRLARTRVGELLLAQTKRMLEGREFGVSISKGSRKVQVAFNRALDDGSISNALTGLRTRVELSDVPSTPTFRQQMLNQLTDLAKSLPGELQGVLIPTIVRGTDLPNKDEVAQLLEQAMGGATGAKTDPDQAETQAMQQQEAMQKEQQVQQQMQAQQDEERQIRLRGEGAKADKALAEAQKARMETEQLAAQLRGLSDTNAESLLAEAMQRREMRALQPGAMTP